MLNENNQKDEEKKYLSRQKATSTDFKIRKDERVLPDLQAYISNTLSDIQVLSSALVLQQHQVDVLKDLTDLKERLLGPTFNPENILPPKTNTKTKGRKSNTKRLASAFEIYEEDVKKRDAKKIKSEKAE